MNQTPGTSRRLRVLQCITRLGLGGAERVAFAIMHELKPHIDFGLFTVHSASQDAIGMEMRETLATASIPWFTGTAIPMKAGGMLPGGLALGRAVRRFRPDVIHFHSETPEACGAAMLQFSMPGTPPALVRTIHNSVFWRYWPCIGRWCDRQLAPAAIACVSAAAQQEFQRYRRDSGVKSASDDSTIIYNGVATPLREPRGNPTDVGIRRILFAGRFEDQKGIDVLCDALPLVRLPPGRRGELLIVGHGTHQKRVDALALRPPVGWQVSVRGPVADLAPIFSECDLVVMPSRFEGLGLVAIEATLAGLPVVATDAPGLREALPANYPWRAKPGDPASLAHCLTAACTETVRWNETVRTAQQFAQERFSPPAMGKAYHALYERAALR